MSTTNAIIGALENGVLPYVETFTSPKVRSSFSFISAFGFVEDITLTRTLLAWKYRVPDVLVALEKFPADLQTVAGYTEAGEVAANTSWGGGYSITNADANPRSPSIDEIAAVYRRRVHVAWGTDLPADVVLTQAAGVVSAFWKGELAASWDSGNGENGEGLNFQLGQAVVAEAQDEHGRQYWTWDVVYYLTCNRVRVRRWQFTQEDVADELGRVGEGVGRLPAKPFIHWDEGADYLALRAWGLDLIRWSDT